MTTETIDADLEIQRAATKLKEIAAILEPMSEDDAFTDILAWSVIVSAFIESMYEAGDMENIAVFETLAKKTYDLVRNCDDHADDERRASQGS